MTSLRAIYDRRADVLYVSTEANGPAVAQEGEDGIVWRYKNSDGTLVGATVMDYEAYWKAHLNSLVGQISANFHVAPHLARSALEGYLG